jgi:hypothetical protein
MRHEILLLEKLGWRGAAVFVLPCAIRQTYNGRSLQILPFAEPLPGEAFDVFSLAEGGTFG